MRKYKFLSLSQRHKIQLFMSFEFWIMSLFAAICIVFLVLYAIDIQISVNFESHICDNFNVILVSIATGYIVSYLFYFLTVHIPDYKQTLANERVMSYYLSKYKNQLLYCFGGIAYFMKSNNIKEIKEIPEIKRLFESTNCNDKIILDVTKSSNKNDLIKNFERLWEIFQYITELNAFHKSRFSKGIYDLQINCWSEFIYNLKDEILHNYQNFQMLEDEDNISLINKNFNIANKAIEIEKLIN